MKSEVKDFLLGLVDWARERDELFALALVGSQARGEAKPDSDIDILLLLNDPSEYLQNLEWLSFFGDVVTSTKEYWGKVISIRVYYSNELEVEFGITDASWGNDPEDTGDKQVIEDGIIVLHEKRRYLTSRLNRFTSGSETSSV
jgi:predicted nucleotidyltransferase